MQGNIQFIEEKRQRNENWISKIRKSRFCKWCLENREGENKERKRCSCTIDPTHEIMLHDMACNMAWGPYPGSMSPSQMVVLKQSKNPPVNSYMLTYFVCLWSNCKGKSIPLQRFKDWSCKNLNTWETLFHFIHLRRDLLTILQTHTLNCLIWFWKLEYECSKNELKLLKSKICCMV